MRSLAAFRPGFRAFPAFARVLAALFVAAIVAGCSSFGDTPDETVGWSASKLYAERTNCPSWLPVRLADKATQPRSASAILPKRSRTLCSPACAQCFAVTTAFPGMAKRSSVSPQFTPPNPCVTPNKIRAALPSAARRVSIVPASVPPFASPQFLAWQQQPRQSD